MNAGAYIIKEDFFSQDEMATIADLAIKLGESKTAVHPDGKYGHVQWFKVPLTRESHSFVDKIYSFLGAEAGGLCVFYYLAPGAVLHPHRDLTGASANARIRFHVPVITNPKVRFEVSRERVTMKPGELWTLDTSYLHSVNNESDETRVHIVIECDINEQVRAHLKPKTFANRCHDVYFAGILGFSFLKALVVNSWRDPKYFVLQLKMIARFIGWRFLGKSRNGEI
ncbi:aspartyl/asparaginyl beta-hydroxylase domain-containing protein [Pandoraea pnomenusa]|uniref:aspartyl/asparaginyl beta-hydroxylase domain-containing protein n=1 Tax=Pandoraea pnomenusa TaxID=93220 RepID=UPI00119880C2|nr:aspartyl/asparaginyl beta-hydroxylase domain-containing protein [Pandoraea pnomenusa]MBN9092327.1 aspartyl/asparaginyl beta-hydroxylase domain-containing protein [Pandoraea pnomenusa]QDX21085.1 aspartyl/asparaginyl beta-hydroxylase domain-containing protein [Pandoraea pnomenusa]